MKQISIVGAGLAGCEAALQLAKRGFEVTLYEMRPGQKTEAHETANLAELVCSNSLKSIRLDTGSGLLKAEMKLLGSELLQIAEKCAVPAGHALAVDRAMFSTEVEAAIQAMPNIKLVRQEITSIPDGMVILATGPLSSEAIMKAIANTIHEDHLYFFDAIAPIVDSDSIDNAIVYAKARYDKGEADYLNCAFNREQYYAFIDALIEGEKHEAHEFENEFFKSEKFNFYENCMPIEELAKRGKDTLRHGVMRPMGLELPSTGQKAFAVIQLRKENAAGSSYNLVGCQTMLRYPEQKRIFRLIPGLQQAEFLRFGSIHRNAYLNAPMVFNHNLSLKANPQVFVAGQLSGVEGYVESIASGLLIALIIAENFTILPPETMLGQLWQHLITKEEKQRFQPVNANFGILPALVAPPRDKAKKKELLSQRAMEALGSAIASRTQREN